MRDVPRYYYYVQLNIIDGFETSCLAKFSILLLKNATRILLDCPRLLQTDTKLSYCILFKMTFSLISVNRIQLFIHVKLNKYYKNKTRAELIAEDFSM